MVRVNRFTMPGRRKPSAIAAARPASSPNPSMNVACCQAGRSRVSTRDHGPDATTGGCHFAKLRGCQLPTSNFQIPRRPAFGSWRLRVGNLDTKRLDERGERGRLLLAARVVEEEAGKRRTPLFQHAYECATGEVHCDAIFRHPRETGTVDRRLDQKVCVIDDERSVHRDLE